ncbi:MAG: urease accessory protein UreD, partial [Sphingobacterium siyangense]
HTQTKIFRNGKLSFIDNQLLRPKSQPIQKMLFFEGYTHQATFVFSALFAQELKYELDEILTVEYNDISYGFTQASKDVVILRALGTDGELLYDFLHMLGQLCWDFTQHKLSERKEDTVVEAITEDEKSKAGEITVIEHRKPLRKGKRELVDAVVVEGTNYA